MRLPLRRSTEPVQSLTEAVGGDISAVWAADAQSMAGLGTAYLRAQRVLPVRDESVARTLITSSVRAADGLLAADPHAKEAATVILRAAEEESTGLISRREQTLARRRYLSGLLFGVVLTIVLLVVVYRAFGWVISTDARRDLNPDEKFALRDLLTCIGGGVIGASISVILRLGHTKHLDLDAIRDGAAKWRIVLGWAFAIALVALVKGGILVVFTDPTAAMLDAAAASGTPGFPTDSDKVVSWFFWGALGILAGFNERWATSLLSRDPVDATAMPTSGGPPPPTDPTVPPRQEQSTQQAPEPVGGDDR